jgi:hypothetical protein
LLAWLALAVWLGAAGARAQIDERLDAFAIPLDRQPLELGVGYDSRAGAPRGEAGACVGDLGTESREAGGPQWSIAVLSRAGGRLLVGVHVSAPTAVEWLASPRLTDAARRLADSDVPAFRELCGDGFVGGRTLGAHLLAEVEVQGPEAARALAELTTGTWSDPEPFRTALAALVTRTGVAAREIPGGRRAEATAVSSEDLVARAVAFPATVSPDDAKPYLATFTPYTEASLAGLLLPDPEELDGRDVAEQVFRSGREGPRSSAAQRAADMRAAQVRREEPEPPPATPATELSPSSGPVVIASPAAPARPAAPAASAGGAALHKQAALVWTEEGELPVFATTQAPGGVYAERVRERSYWVPGAGEATPAVVRAIARAKAAPPARGTTVVVAEVGPTVVVMTDAAPVEGTHAELAGERRAWIAGVDAPDAAQRAALAAAIRADAEAQ